MYLPIVRNRTRPPAARPWLWAEAVAWTLGLVAVSVWAVVSGLGHVGAQQALEEFEALQTVQAPAELPVRRSLEHLRESPDQRLWSPQRRRAWHLAIGREAPAPLAVLRIARIDLEVAVLEGTGDWTLNRAVGHIENTARPGGGGNVGIAGHRDGFFRGLKEIQPGDELELETVGAVDLYRVERTWIVGREKVSVLDPTAERSVTLVTCYPFYLVGSAPDRFIVRAVWTGARAAGAVSN